MKTLDTSPAKQLSKRLKLVLIHSEGGPNQVKSVMSIPVKEDLEKEIDSIVSKMSIECLESLKAHSTKLQFVMQELVPRIRKKIWIDRLNSLMKSIQQPEYFKTSDLESIGKDPDCSPFWKKFTKVLSEQLWLATKTDSVDLDRSCWNGSLKKTMSNSWFSTQVSIPKTPLKNSQMTFWQSLLSLLQEITDLEQGEIIDSESVKRAKNIRIKPTKLQKQTLKEWFGASRWIYNKAVALYNDGTIRKEKVDKNTGETIKTKYIFPIKQLREILVNNSVYNQDNEWMLQYAYDLRDEPIREFKKNVDANISKGDKFKMSFKSKRYDEKQTISALKKHWGRKSGFYSPVLSSDKMKSSEPLPDKLPSDATISLDKLKHYTLNYSYDKPIQPKKDSDSFQKAIFIDPGVKNFYTGYSFDAQNGFEMITIGKRNIERISRLLHYKRKLQSKEKKTKNKKEKLNFKNAFRRISRKIKNLICDMHNKISKWLTQEYNAIHLPKLNFHGCTKLNKKSKAKLATYRHCRMRSILKTHLRFAWRFAPDYSIA